MACLWNCYMSVYWQGCRVSPTQLSVLSLGPECLHLHRRNGIHYRSIAGRTKSCRACEFMRTMWSKWKCLCASEWDRQCGAYDEQFHYCWFVEPAHIQGNQRAGCTCCLCYLSYFISKYNSLLACSTKACFILVLLCSSRSWRLTLRWHVTSAAEPWCTEQPR